MMFNKSTIGICLQKLLAILILTAMFTPLYSLHVSSNVKGVKINTVHITDNLSYKPLNLNFNTLKYLLTKQLSEYGIYDTSNGNTKLKSLHVDIGCIGLKNSEIAIYSVTVSVEDDNPIENFAPDVIYFYNHDFGYARNNVEEVIEGSIKFQLKQFIDLWVICNTTKK